MLRLNGDPTNDKLVYVAEYLSEQTADASWMLCTGPRYKYLPVMAVALERIGGKMPHDFEWDVLINKMYDYVKELEASDD
jgi:hypothetical protein